MKISEQLLNLDNQFLFAVLSGRGLGRLMVFLSAFLFYFTTVIVRWGSEATDLSIANFVFARFLGGFIGIVPVVFFLRGLNGLRGRKFHFLIGRAVFNLLAVLSLYKCIETRTLAEGNILNLSYCVIVPLLSLLIYRPNREDCFFQVCLKEPSGGVSVE